MMLLPVFVGSYYFSFWLRYEGQMGPSAWDRISSTIALVVAVKLVLFGWHRVDQGWSRFVSFYDLLTLIQAATTSLLVIVLVDRLFLPSRPIPRSVFLLDWGATIAALGGARMLLRLVRERHWFPLFSNGRVRAFIVGANDAGESLLRTIMRNGSLTYRVVGFLDEDADRVGTRLAGLPVLGTIDETCRLADRHGVQEVLIASEGLPGRHVRKLLDEARRYSIHVKVLPSYEQLISGRVAVRPRLVSINDLLRREPVRLEMSNIRQWIDGRVLMVTGSAGSIGSEICRQLLKFSPQKLVAVDRSENGQFFLDRELRGLDSRAELEIAIADVLDERRMQAVLQRHRPRIVFHAAAFKHVSLMESHPGEAVKNIVVATRRLADLATAQGVESFVMISTDKAVNPTCVMGACKRAAELYVQSLAARSPCRFITVRFGNVLDSAGSVVQIFRRQIAAGGPVTVTDPRMQRFFMTIPEAARLVIQAGVIGQGGEILLLDMGEPVRIVDLAADMIRLSGLEVGRDVEIEFIGLRPGEKLAEELHAASERHLPTRHPSIVVAESERRDANAVVASIERLEKLAEADDGLIVAKLAELVPEYQPAGTAKRRRQPVAA
jgi:FlaA1/EpsC-like NDP-sugar epimerase